jgi:hypothetical protein
MGANNSQTNLEKIVRALTYDATAFANQTITVNNLATASLTVPTGTKYALCYISSSTATDFIRYWLDGSTPTSSQGIKRLTETAFDISGADDIKNFKCYASVASGLITLNVQYFR